MTSLSPSHTIRNCISAPYCYDQSTHYLLNIGALVEICSLAYKPRYAMKVYNNLPSRTVTELRNAAMLEARYTLALTAGQQRVASAAPLVLLLTTFVRQAHTRIFQLSCLS